jgi:hypothetical protein
VDGKFRLGWTSVKFSARLNLALYKFADKSINIQQKNLVLYTCWRTWLPATVRFFSEFLSTSCAYNGHKKFPIHFFSQLWGSILLRKFHKSPHVMMQKGAPIVPLQKLLRNVGAIMLTSRVITAQKFPLFLFRYHR